MQTLSPNLRRQLERTIVRARDVAEAGAREALEALAVHHHEPYRHMSSEQRTLRRRLRTHARQLGDRLDARSGSHGIDHLVHECAYEHWHGMLFARFLAENDLLIEPTAGVDISLAECEDLAKEEGIDKWMLAARFAHDMLPQVFRPDQVEAASRRFNKTRRDGASTKPEIEAALGRVEAASRRFNEIHRGSASTKPVFEVQLAREHRLKLEGLVEDLPDEVFVATDSLGWVYQFWQSKKKDEVNRSEVKIGADELPAVTQLFTEPYMVQFLLHNSLGAWWISRHPDKPCPVDLTYLRKVEAASRRFNKTRRDGASTNPMVEAGSGVVEAASRRFNKMHRDGASTLGFYDPKASLGTLSGNLPHWRQDGASYFVTFRTADSLPQEKLKQWEKEREQWLATHPEPHSDEEKREYQQRFSERIQQWLDVGYGECVLAQSDIKTVVERALRHFDGERYHLHEFVVMPNHVHALVSPLGEYRLSNILHSWKSFTAHEINQRLGREAPFWQKESFDHLVRNAEQAERIRQYIHDNPMVEAASRRFDETRRDGASTNPKVDATSGRVEAASRRFNEMRRDGASTNPKADATSGRVEAASRRFDETRRDGASTSPMVEAASGRFEETRRDGASTPAAGGFEGWPDELSAFRLLDPCCGSGHFLVAAFLMLVPMRMSLEGLNATQAVDAVLRDNLHGLELDRRCVAIAAFALALEAWRYPDAGGYRPLPKLNLAWCGQPVTGKREQWLALAGGDEHLEAGMAALYDTFRDAPVLGSLIDPARSITEDLLTAGFAELEPLLEQALRDHSGEEEWEETAIAARGLAEAARLLGDHYHLVITNVPYLARGKQGERLRTFCATHYPKAKNDLANVFLERCLELSGRSAVSALAEKKAAGGRFYGVTQIVMPQNWLFLTSYRKQREHLLKEVRWDLLARLGPGAFDTISGEVVNVILLTLTRSHPNVDDQLHGIDASAPRTAAGKAEVLQNGEVVAVSQQGQLGNPDARVALEDVYVLESLGDYCSSIEGLTTGDLEHFVSKFWEGGFDQAWEPYIQNVDSTLHYGGRTDRILWEDKTGVLSRFPTAHNFPSKVMNGRRILGEAGLRVTQMRDLPISFYSGEVFGKNAATVIPNNPAHLPAIWCFCSSPEYNKAVRRFDQSLKVTNATLVKVPFDLDHWTQVAKEKYPHGLPKPYSNDPTQWIFHGHPCGSVVWDEEKKRLEAASTLRTDATVLQVAVARLLGYRWPAEDSSGVPPLETRVEAASRRFKNNKRQDGASTWDGASTLLLADEAREWVEKAKALYAFEDEDGIVCIPSVRGERPAHDRLLQLLEAAWGGEWNDGVLAKLLVEAGSRSLDDWLRNQFFEQHCKLFHHRPFIWHIWDGRKRDGFHALVNYHKLCTVEAASGRFDSYTRQDAASTYTHSGRRLLESLTYSHLGDWIARQRDGVKRGEGGAEDRLAAALELQKRLVAIIEGEPPFDLFVRWKPLVEATSRRLKRPEAASTIAMSHSLKVPEAASTIAASPLKRPEAAATGEQPIGWEPDINDGVRLNIRPFMARDIPGGKKGAGILRAKPNIKWEKDRGKEPLRDQEQFPWFWNNGTFTGERVNDVHLTNAEKQTARERAEDK